MSSLGESGGVESADTVVPDSAATAPTGAPPEYLPSGSKIGRYLLLNSLGRGGMGVVYKAFDPELDRNVALKIVRFAEDGDDEAKAAGSRARLAREAQAIAKVSHPNVVGVHDVGVAGHNVFIAMEYVAGATLREWGRRAERPWRDIANTCIQAGRGLAAAHEAGLIHRDFKPENVLVGEEGRPRVLDFGLVRAAFGDDDDEDDDQARALTPARRVETGKPLTTPLTRAGEVMGTPGYMAPEQYEGRRADEASDQFSFCVTLYEALYGERPFLGRTIREIRKHVFAQSIADPKRSHRVPARVRQVILRGLRVERAERHPSMVALLSALERAMAPRAPRRIAVGAAVVGVAAIAFVVGQAAPAVATPCRGGARKLVGVWDDDARMRLRTAFDAVVSAQSSATFARVDADLTGYANAWVQKQRDVCEATRIHGDQSAAALDLRMACLDRQLADVRELTAVLADGDDKVLARAAVVTGRLPDLSDCDDIAALGAIASPPGDARTRQRIGEVEAHLGRAKALGDAGKLADARALATSALESATRIAHEPLSARAYFAVGVIDRLEGKGGAAHEALFQSLVRAERVGDERLRADAMIELVFVVGYLENKPDDGLTFGTMATALVARLHGVDRLEARLLSNIGVIYQDTQRYEEAAEKFIQSLALGERVYGRDSFDTVAALNNLGSALNELGRNDEAVRYLERAVVILEGLFGPSHPHLAAVLINLGLTTNDLGKHEVALAHFRRAVEIYEALVGPDHRMVAPALSNQADVLAALGRYDESLALYERSLAIRTAAYGGEHPLVALVLTGYGGALARAGREAEAARAFERARDIWIQAHGPNHADVARALVGLGETRRRQGRGREALAHYERALEIQTGVLGADHVALVQTLTGIGKLHLELGRADRAVAPLERAVATADAKKATPMADADARFALAIALWSREAERSRARALAEQARARFASMGAAAAKSQAEAAAWLAERPAP